MQPRALVVISVIWYTPVSCSVKVLFWGVIGAPLSSHSYWVALVLWLMRDTDNGEKPALGLGVNWAVGGSETVNVCEVLHESGTTQPLPSVICVSEME